ncbi:MAG: cardiolipin synthase [Intestinimonas sp.]|jgi:cardiolipin synthase|nr:cardiolipin synthase [Intestinimonas sp.]
MKKMVSLLFHRIFWVAFALLIQLMILFLMVVRFSRYFVYFYWLSVAISVVAVIWIIGNKSDPGYKIAWLVPILSIPIFGGLIYLMFGGSRLNRRTRLKMQCMADDMQKELACDYKADQLLPLGEDAVHQARYLEHIAYCPVYGNTKAEYFSSGELCFPRMLQELKKAKQYIFIEYFIIQSGTMWDSILKILKEKAAEGVDVRVLYDDIGCTFTLPRNYNRHLEEDTGIQCAVFNPFVPILSLRLNNRDHRKIMVIDGKVAFTGGINLADEYINTYEKHGYWKDSAICLKGEAAWSMAVMFLSLWDYTREVEDDYEAFRPVCPRCLLKPGEPLSFVQPYTDNPLDDEPVGQSVYLNLINKARRYVYITTPYLIVSDSVNTALCNAAKSGVDVRIMTPAIPDKKIVFEMTRAHYPALLEAGVQIFEYTPGFVHSKTFSVDDLYGTVGSINLDYRSLFLHFENGVLLFHDPCIRDIRDDFLSAQQKCRQITREFCRTLSWKKRLLQAVLRIFSPLL